MCLDFCSSEIVSSEKNGFPVADVDCFLADGVSSSSLAFLNKAERWDTIAKISQKADSKCVSPFTRLSVGEGILHEQRTGFTWVWLTYFFRTVVENYRQECRSEVNLMFIWQRCTN